MPLPFALPPLALPVAAAARAAAVRVRDGLRRSSVTLDGVAVVLIVAAALCGGWWLARHVKARTLADYQAARAAGASATVKDIDAYVAGMRGEIAVDDARITGLRQDIVAVLERLRAAERAAATPPQPAAARVEKLLVPVILPALGAPMPPPDAKATKPRSPGIDDANYPDDLLSKLNAINTRTKP